MPPQKILIFMSNTGGGHRASALALTAELHARYAGRFEIEIIDLLADHLPWPLCCLPETYPRAVRYTPRFWEWLWKQSARPSIGRTLTAGGAWLARPSLEQVIDHFDPDLIVSVHPLAQTIPLHALHEMKRDLPFVTVVTDLETAHPFWFNSHVQLCCVASETAYRRALQCGLEARQLRLYGLPIRPGFGAGGISSASLKERLGMAPDLPAVLLTGGGGVGRITDIAVALSRSMYENGSVYGQLAIICGHNNRLRRALSAQEWSIPTVIEGFVENMQEWMGACDCLVTKAGPGTIAESLASGLPMVLCGYILGQEAGNVSFVVERGAGIYNPDPMAIATQIRRWFENDRGELAQMAKRARMVARPHATAHIVDAITRLLD